ncbi:hypothetical protein sos41_23890 [Alphaproteobacteria bacterium SO-S41]|nr:hypothetical protein sos41_23890 [Alphaproteobacteria bacterium SO-S41]
MPTWLINYLLLALGPLAERWNWLHRQLNRLIINRAVTGARTRPHPWSTAHAYISWTSLTDHAWSARHLPEHPQEGLPAPALVSRLFERGGKPQALCAKSTCLFPAFAQYLTDGFIRTRMPNSSANETEEVRKQNTSNHQIDLCPLYGRTKAQTDVLRLKSPAQRGRLKSQRINGEDYAPFLYEDDGETVRAEFKNFRGEDILDTPLGVEHKKDPGLRRAIFAYGGDRANATPQVSMINTLLLREHNRVADALAADHPDWDDDRVFETARNILIVIYIKLVIEEYINHIMPLPFRLRAEPSVAWNAPWNKPNWITTEFSLLYRWHSLIPDKMVWGGTAYPVGATGMDNRILTTIGLAQAFQDIAGQPAGKLGAFNTADDLVQMGIEARAIDQNRRCRLAPYTAYRRYLDLAVPERFEDISSDPAVVRFLRETYVEVGKIDFYAGLFAEDTVKNSPLPELILRFVAVDAFSQALTNPLLSEHVWKEGSTFTAWGRELIAGTNTMRDILARNVAAPLGDARIAMTRADWRRG